MDERRHHENDPDGRWGDARVAREQLSWLDQHAAAQLDLSDLQAVREAVFKAKQETAQAIAAFGAVGAAEKNPERQALHDRLQALAASLDEINRRIAAVSAPMARCDRGAHVEDLRRRVGER